MNLVDSLVYQYRRLRYRSKPAPKIRVYARRSVPAWVVRVLAAAATASCVVLAGSRSPMPTGLVIALAAGMVLWMLARPGYEVAVTSVLMAGLLLFSSVSFNPLIGWILVAAYFCVRLSMVSCLVKWTSIVELRAILTWRDAVVAALTALIGCASVLPGVGVWAVVLGAAGLLGVAMMIYTRTG